jgi:hypothetical protein ilyop_2051
MPFVLFKAGDYGAKGKWSNEQLSNLINNKKELDVIPFHTSEFTKLGMLRNEIPVIGKFKNISVKDDEIIADDVEIFNRGEFKDRKVDRLSVEIENGEITRVGALPVGVEPAVSNSGSFVNGEFSQGFEMDWINQKNIIEFSDNKNNNGGNGEMNFEELLKKLLESGSENKIKAANEIMKTLSKEELEKIEVPKGEETKKTEDEIREEVKKEFARESEIKEFMLKNSNKITPALKKLGIEEFIKQSFVNNNGVIEFSENGNNQTVKSSDILSKLFENLPSYGGNKPLEFGSDDDNISRQQQMIADEIAGYKARNNLK